MASWFGQLPSSCRRERRMTTLTAIGQNAARTSPQNLIDDGAYGDDCRIVKTHLSIIYGIVGSHAFHPDRVHYNNVSVPH